VPGEERWVRNDKAASIDLMEAACQIFWLLASGLLP
jgi:hypothetical protein